MVAGTRAQLGQRALSRCREHGRLAGLDRLPLLLDISLPQQYAVLPLPASRPLGPYTGSIAHVRWKTATSGSKMASAVVTTNMQPNIVP
jgi:hypothetical protein